MIVSLLLATSLIGSQHLQDTIEAAGPTFATIAGLYLCVDQEPDGLVATTRGALQNAIPAEEHDTLQIGFTYYLAGAIAGISVLKAKDPTFCEYVRANEAALTAQAINRLP